MQSNLTSIFQAIGGIGIFLLGMMIMTEGFKQLTGNRIRMALMQFTNSPTSGAITGMISTMILQSSSATIVAAVGFVGVGMMQFSEALGIIFGANIGTTITGWLVALFGFKFNLTEIAFPLIFLGMVLKLFSKGKLAIIGYSIAGFSLIFVAIGLMQEGMKGFEGVILSDYLPTDSWIGRLELIGLGVIATFITQSSSAGVATTLTLLFAQMISFEQAVALVIGMDIGTTITPLLATIGGSTDVKRTGLSHVIYNLFTGVGAFFLITPYIYLWHTFSPYPLMENTEVALVAFHSLFNILGVLIVLPFTRNFAHLIEKLVPSNDRYLYELDYSLPKKEPKLALLSLQQAIQKTFLASLLYINEQLNETEDKTVELRVLQKSMDELQEYMEKISLIKEGEKEWEQLMALLHGMNHLDRLIDRCEELRDESITLLHSEELLHGTLLLTKQNSTIIELFAQNNFEKALSVSLMATQEISQSLELLRDKIIFNIAKDYMDHYTGVEILNEIKWLKRMNTHIDKVITYYEKALHAGIKENPK
ncbi:MAG: hypothetical protein KU29_12780 [Sulfurovum sp. FS06-10]|nr:MAG: hypothetical protein KU29_12780 [Sulfurovum sp. FS06-10]